MFLVFEKEVLSMSDDIKELDLYFLPKHKKRMNEEIESYKKKMNINYGLELYEITDETTKHYISAYSEKQARYIATNNFIEVDKVRKIHEDVMMSLNNVDLTVSNLLKGANTSVVGKFNYDNYKLGVD